MAGNLLALSLSYFYCSPKKSSEVVFDNNEVDKFLTMEVFRGQSILFYTEENIYNQMSKHLA